MQTSSTFNDNAKKIIQRCIKKVFTKSVERHIWLIWDFNMSVNDYSTERGIRFEWKKPLVI